MSRGMLVLAYSNGKMFQGDEGVMYDGPDPSMFKIRYGITFEVLKQKIHSILNLEANQEVSKVTYRFPISANKYRPVELKNDDDVSCMFHSHAQHPNLGAIELYIDVNNRQTRMSQTSARDRSQIRMATRGHTRTWSKAMHISISADGNMFQGAENVIYNNGINPFVFDIRRGVTFEGLKQKIHSMLNLEANQVVSKVTYRFSTSGNQVLKYRSVQLRNDDAMDCMFDSHEQHPYRSAIDLYVDVEKVKIHPFSEAHSPWKDGQFRFRRGLTRW